MTIEQICASFDIGGEFVDCAELTTGNINSSYYIKFVRDGEKKEYILQKINKGVFTEPEKVMDNIVRVTEFIRNNIVKEGLSTRKFVMRAFTAKDGGKPFVIDDLGEYWRCYRYIANSVTYDACEDLEIIEKVGQAFGHFQKCLDGFDADSLFISIPDFHNTIKRYDAFIKAVEEDKCNRARLVEREIKRLLEMKEQACFLQDCFEKGLIPARVVHNDTKCNNVSFDKTTKEALAVLDLDTVMPGAVAHDFGDAVRSIASTLIEDDADYDNVKIDINKYESFTKGFVLSTKDMLTEKEKQTLNDGVFAMTVELSVRFLTDYLNGDKYFKTKYLGHNLTRAKNQLALAEDILARKHELDEILKKYL